MWPTKPAPAAKVAPSEPRSGPKPAVLIGAGAAALIAVVAAGAMFMRGGGSEPVPSIQAGPDAGGNADIVLGPGTDQPVTDANAAGVAPKRPARGSQSPGRRADQCIRCSAQGSRQDGRCRSAPRRDAEEPRPETPPSRRGLEPPRARGRPGQPPRRRRPAPRPKPNSGAGVSAAKLSQFYGIVDSARGMAKRVMRSSNSANAQLARSYDANLKTLRDSIRGVNSDREADRLIKQANQTKAYVEFLVKQSP